MLKRYNNFIYESNKPDDEVTWEEEPEPDDEWPATIPQRHGTFCVIDDEIFEYDGMSSKTLAFAKQFYKNWTYIGSGHIIYVGGKIWEQDELKHFFIKPGNRLRKLENY